jgi:hypothetical protein
MKYSYLVFVYVLSILLLDSCTTAHLINGTYSGKQHPHVFIFSEDSTFKYEYRAMWYSESSGTWQKRENKIYLNSFEQRNTIPVDYAKAENNQKRVIINVKVNVSDKAEEDYICFPYVNGKSVIMDPGKGSYSFDSEVSVNNIYFLIAKRPFVLRGTGYKMSYDDVKTETIYPHLSVGESLDVTINIIDSLFGYKVFDNTKLKVKRNKIIFKDGGKINKLSLKK